MREIKFKGRNYILTSDEDTDSPIATKYQYENGFCSFAHLYSTGKICRYGEEIGTKEDIEFGEKIEDIQQKDIAPYNMVSHPSYNREKL